MRRQSRGRSARSKQGQYRVKSLQIKKLWGYRNLNIRFKPEVNCLIGRNGSGKTSVMHIIWSMLTGDLGSLASRDWASAKLTLQEWRTESPDVELEVRQEHAGEFVVRIDDRQWELNELMFHTRGRYAAASRRVNEVAEEAIAAIRSHSDAVWLPVSRRLPISDIDDSDAELRRVHGSQLESVDHTMRRLMREMRDYRARINVEQTKHFKQFERDVLMLMLYDPKRRSEGGSFRLTDRDDEQRLVRAFRDAGLMNDALRDRISDHFSAALRVSKKFGSGDELDSEDWSVLPVIERTHRMLEIAEQLEKGREGLLEAVNRFIDIANEFLAPKSLILDEGGQVFVADPRLDEPLAPSRLSSGEKQVLILLVQALLGEDKPVVYLADEPELSLHVEWQEMLIRSLKDLGGEMQLIVATHSPDIVSGFGDSVIDLSQDDGHFL